jgi:TfoX/Sxy family transcriptional regulator of competence genes
MGMATRPEAVETILAQAAGACSVAARRMFSEYTLYANGKLVGLICDDQLFIEPTPAGRAFIGEVDEVPPYEGAKPSFLISGEQMSDGAWLAELVSCTAAALPVLAKKPRSLSRP